MEGKRKYGREIKVSVNRETLIKMGRGRKGKKRMLVKRKRKINK